VNRTLTSRAGVQLAFLAGVPLALLALAMKSGGIALVATAALLGLLAVAVIAGIDVIHASLILTCGFVFTCSWTGFFLFGHQRPRALFLLLALLLAIAAQMNGRFPRVPWWYTALVATVLLDLVVKLMLPTSQQYLDGRYLESNAGIWGPQVLNTHISDFGTGLRFLFTLIGAALTISICSLHFKRAPLWIALSYAAGASLSGLIAFADQYLHTGIAPAITGIGFRGDRATGFADHPVLMAAGNVYAVAIAVWFTTTTNLRYRLAGFVLLPGLVFGTYASRSRGGEISMALAIGLCVLILPQYRRHLHTAAVAVGGLIAAMFVLFPGSGHALLVAMRLAGNSGPSDSGRIAVIKQGWHDFIHSPIDGIGLHVMAEAHNVTVQTLASGGLILFFGFMCLQIGSIVASYRLIPFHPMAAPLFATVITGVAFGNLENTLTEPLVYVPVALIVALRAQQLAFEEEPEESAVLAAAPA
jgi:O-Antigen ligase